MNNPLPIPKTFTCPYCEKKTHLCKFDTDDSLAYYSHTTEEVVKVSQKWNVIIRQVHFFSCAFRDGKWQVVNERLHSSKICETAELMGTSGYRSCDRDD